MRKLISAVQRCCSSRPVICTGLVLALGFASALPAQPLSSAPAIVNLSLDTAETISVSVTANGAVTFPANLIKPGTSVLGNVVPAFTTSWTLLASRTNVSVYAYFTGANALTGTVNAANTIAATQISGAADGGAATPFSAKGSPFGTGMLVSSTAITAANLNSSKSDTLALSLTVPAAGIPTDSYNGLLNIQAQATP